MLNINFTSQEEKDKLVGRLQRVTQSLTPEGSAATLYNVSMLSAMMDLVEGSSPGLALSRLLQLPLPSPFSATVVSEPVQAVQITQTVEYCCA